MTDIDSNNVVHFSIGAQGIEETAVNALLSPPAGPAHLLSGEGDIGGFTHIDLDVSSYAFRRAPADNQPCVLGVRPEDISVDASSGHRGTVSLVEPMGNHRVIWFDYHGGQIASIAQDTATTVVDEVTGFSIDSKRISLFDETGGDRL